MVEKDHQRRLDAVRDSNRRKTLRDSLAWLKQAARTPMEANLQRSGNTTSPCGTMPMLHGSMLVSTQSAAKVTQGSQLAVQMSCWLSNLQWLHM